MNSAFALQEWLIQYFGAEKFQPGLERVGTFVASELSAIKRLNPHITTIAGTNGKGETALTLAELNRRHGRSYVLWTSPHLLRVTERFRCEEGEISVTELRSLVEKVRLDALKVGVGLSYYEVLFCAFLRWGIDRQAPFWIMEVGLGGRLDAVNLLQANVVGLTSISRDHQEFLGHRYDSILREKLGVCRTGRQLVSALESRYLQEHTEKFCQTLGVPWRDLFAEGLLQRSDSFSQRNRQLALALWQGPITGQNVMDFGEFPGRGEVWRLGTVEFTFYGSHNPDGMRKLVQLLGSGFYTKAQENFHQIWAAFSRRSLSDLRAMARMLAGLATTQRQVVLTQFNHPKAMPLDEWWREEGFPISTIHEWTELLTRLRPGNAGLSHTKILVVGSYYFVAAVQSDLLELGATHSGG